MNMTHRHASLARQISALAATCALFAASGQAATLYWDGQVDLAWNNLANWSVTSDGSIPGGAETNNPTAVPGANDDVVFNISGLNAGPQVTVNSDVAARSLTFNGNGNQAYRISNTGGTRQFLLGEGGVTVNAGSGQVNLGNTSATVRFGITASQTWTNHSTSNIVLQNAGGAANTGTDAVTLTINNTSTGQTSFNNALQDGTAGRVLTLIINSSGSGGTSLNSTPNHTYSGGTIVQRGLFTSNSNVIGLGGVNLSATATHTATVRVASTGSVANNFTSSGAANGTNVLEFTATSGTLDGSITLNQNLNVGVRLSGATGVVFNGNITGTANLIKGQYQGGNSGLLTLAGHASHSGDTIINNGAFTLADTGSLTFYIGADGVNNRITGTSTGLATFDGTFNFNLTNASLIDGNSWSIVTLSNRSFGSTFDVAGFTEIESGIWSNGTGFTFSEATGLLAYSVIPEPSAFAGLAGLGALGFAALRRRRARA